VCAVAAQGFPGADEPRLPELLPELDQPVLLDCKSVTVPGGHWEANQNASAILPEAGKFLG
jgi:hypothetical protein